MIVESAIKRRSITSVAILFGALASYPSSGTANPISVINALKAVRTDEKMVDAAKAAGRIGAKSAEGMRDESGLTLDGKRLLNSGENAVLVGSKIVSISKLTYSRNVVVRFVQAALHRMPKLIYAAPAAKAFGRKFLQGAKDPTFYLNQLRRKNANMLESWESVSPQFRVFVIASGEDLHDAKMLEKRLESNGFKVFFYKFCTDVNGALCDQEEVGAFFGTSGHVISIESFATKKSIFIPVETAITGGLLNGSLVYVLSSEDLISAMEPIAKLAQAGAKIDKLTEIEIPMHVMISDPEFRQRQK